VKDAATNYIKVCEKGDGGESGKEPRTASERHLPVKKKISQTSRGGLKEKEHRDWKGAAVLSGQCAPTKMFRKENQGRRPCERKLGEKNSLASAGDLKS